MQRAQKGPNITYLVIALFHRRSFKSSSGLLRVFPVFPSHGPEYLAKLVLMLCDLAVRDSTAFLLGFAKRLLHVDFSCLQCP